MQIAAHVGTVRLLFRLLLAFGLIGACTESTDKGYTATDAATTSDGKCSAKADCVLISKGCCGACEPTLDNVRAVLRANREAAEKEECPSPVSCGPCAPTLDEPLSPRVVAACEAGACVARDVRRDAATACTKDADCTLVSRGCCPGCGADPSGWISVRTGESAPVSCDPIPPCAPCSDAITPKAFCATDGHCAVQEIPRVNGETSTTCFSPSQNVDHAYDDKAVGCDCFSQGAETCIADQTGRKVALICGEKTWSAVKDGPCGP